MVCRVVFAQDVLEGLIHEQDSGNIDALKKMSVAILHVQDVINHVILQLEEWIITVCKSSSNALQLYKHSGLLY